MSNLKDVAKRAGVSVTTVSNFINDIKPIKEETRVRIIEAIQYTAYRYNTNAASLKRNDKELRNIGVISVVDQNVFFSELFFKLERACFDKGFTVTSCFRQEEGENLKRYLNLISGKVDGIIVISISNQKINDVISNLHGTPIVAIDFDFGNVTTSCGGTNLDINNFQGGYVSAKHIIDKGHKNIVCLTGPAALKTTTDRILGFKQALSESNIPHESITFIEGDYTFNCGRKVMYDIHSSGTIPSAIICHNDLMAIGVQNSASELGINIPNDLSVIGYDDIEIARMSSPPLTTMRIPLDEIAYQAIEQLITKTHSNGVNCNIKVQPSLIVRGSVGTPDFDKGIRKGDNP